MTPESLEEFEKKMNVGMRLIELSELIGFDVFSRMGEIHQVDFSIGKHEVTV